jgi:hypothetical protein
VTLKLGLTANRFFSTRLIAYALHNRSVALSND